PVAPTSPKKVGHDHPNKGPHGGPLAEWGEEQYHVEFTVDRAKKRATVYILDSTARTAVPIAAESVTLSLTKPAAQITVRAEPQDGAPRGQASRFSGSDEKLGPDGGLEGEISATIAGTPFSGDFMEHARK